jgi:chorismate mutase/prephenate dehydrogenase
MTGDIITTTIIEIAVETGIATGIAGATDRFSGPGSDPGLFHACSIQRVPVKRQALNAHRPQLLNLPMDLFELRQQLSSLDTQLIELIANRQRIVAEIGRVKLEDGRSTRDFKREKEVLDLALNTARGLGVDPDLAEQIMRLLIRSSLANQERDRVIAEGRGNGQSVLVIGGAGKMGGWFADFFRSQGFDVAIADPGCEDGPAVFSDWRTAGLDFDVIVVAAPLAISGKILCELAERKPRGLVFDIGSLKSPLKTGLERLREAGCSVTSLHPMFGPDTRLLSGRHLIFVDAGDEQATAQAKGMFASTMVERLDMNLDDHDRLIAYVLGLSHALNIVFFTALAESGEAAPRLAQLSSTTFDAQLMVAANVARENPRLYFEIQNLNRFGMQPLQALREAAERVHALVENGDEQGFVAMMEQGRAYLAQRR